MNNAIGGLESLDQPSKQWMVKVTIVSDPNHGKVGGQKHHRNLLWRPRLNNVKTFLITLTGISGFLRLLLLPPPDIGGALIGNTPLPRSIAKARLSLEGLSPIVSLSRCPLGVSLRRGGRDLTGVA